MPDTMQRLSAACEGLVRPAAGLIISRRVAAAGLAVLLIALLPPAAGLTRATPAQATRADATLPVFQGPTRGVAATQTLLGTDFSLRGSLGINLGNQGSPANAVVGHAAGATIPIGAGVFSYGAGTEALLYLSAPGVGHFKASLAIADDDTSGLTLSTARLLVLGRQGFTTHYLSVSATKGVVTPIDIDVSGGIAMAIDFLTAAHSYIYAMSLTATARALRPVPLTGGGMIVGATPVAASALSYQCSTEPTTTVLSVSRVTLPVVGSFTMLPCGVITVKLPPGASGTLAVRFGTNDLWAYTSLPTPLAMRVLDASGHLLRKAIGLTYSGNGLQPLWVDVKGGSTVTLAMGFGATFQVVLTGLSLIGHSFAPHPNPNHEEFGSPSGASEAIAPDALITSCASVGMDDITVNQLPVIRDTYLIGTGCGVAELIMTDAHGAFHARLGVSDTNPSRQPVSVALVVLDQNSHPLYQAAARATKGRAGVPVSVRLDGGSILQIRFTSPGPEVLYDLTMTGHATVYNRVFAPSEPPVTVPGGVAIDTRGFTLGCNAMVTTADTLLIHEAALEQWSLNGAGCGTAALDLRKLPYAHDLFSARFGIPVANQTEGIAHLHVTVVGAAGTAVDHIFTVRAGYGAQPLRVRLAGAVTLRLSWADGFVVAFAMTAS